jgi:hypothetical protein
MTSKIKELVWIKFLKCLFLVIVMSANLLQLQAFTFNMYSGRGSALTMTVIDIKQNVIYKENIFENFKISNFLFLSDRVADKFCDIRFANKVTVNEKNFKSHEC